MYGTYYVNTQQVQYGNGTVPLLGEKKLRNRKKKWVLRIRIGSMRIRIQHFRTLRIRILFRKQGFENRISKKIYVQLEKSIFDQKL
jgi:hypothetical protein